MRSIDFGAKYERMEESKKRTAIHPYVIIPRQTDKGKLFVTETPLLCGEPILPSMFKGRVIIVASSI
jgi:hypothetical protein